MNNSKMTSIKKIPKESMVEIKEPKMWDNEKKNDQKTRDALLTL